MISRRKLLEITIGSGAALALTPELLRALQAVQQPGGALIQRAIPSTGESIPTVGLSFSNHVACADRTALKEVVRTFADNGARVFDAMHGSADSERFHATVAKELGIQDRLFWSTRGTPPGGPGGPTPPVAASVNTHIETWLERLGVPRMDLVMLGTGGDPAAFATWFAALKAHKQAGRVRDIGVQAIGRNGAGEYPGVEAVMRNEQIDFIGVNYDVGDRERVENVVLPLARERKIGVMAFFPFGNNAGTSCGAVSRNLFARVGNRPLPEWAAEFDATTWAQFFLKYVISHPDVTVARVGTTKVTHMVDNIGGGIGRLPDEATRKRMAAFIDALPAVAAPPPAPQAPGIALSAAILDRYVGEYQAASGLTAAFRRDETTLLVRLNTGGEYPLSARSETRFQRREVFFEFQPDGQGKVTSAIMEQNAQRMPLTRK